MPGPGFGSGYSSNSAVLRSAAPQASAEGSVPRGPDALGHFADEEKRFERLRPRFVGPVLLLSRTKVGGAP